jgi:hypothetical protein
MRHFIVMGGLDQEIAKLQTSRMYWTASSRSRKLTTNVQEHNRADFVLEQRTRWRREDAPRFADVAFEDILCVSHGLRIDIPPRCHSVGWSRYQRAAIHVLGLPVELTPPPSHGEAQLQQSPGRFQSAPARTAPVSAPGSRSRSRWPEGSTRGAQRSRAAAAPSRADR